MAADAIAFDAIEQILMRSDVEDVIRYKSVCKPWYSLISSPYFVESHFKHVYNRQLNNNKRISLPGHGIGSESTWLVANHIFIIGSSNGLVCVSPKDFELLIVNPCTRQTMKILQPPPEPLPKSTLRWHLVWGFGYDSSNNDYKIVVGLVTKETSRTRFYVFSLKSCLWKFIQEIDYMPTNNTVSGILYDGALHWFITNQQNNNDVILSFNLSREEFTETQPPDHPLYEYHPFQYKLGVMEGCLCIYNFRLPSIKIWVLRSYNDEKQSWVALPHNYEMKHDVAYHMKIDDYSRDDKPYFSNTGKYIDAPVFLPTLVSPHVNMDSSSKPDPNDDVISKRKRKRLGKKNRKRNVKLIKGPRARA